jgi:RNA polymerase sigma factor (sigma-70 family)
VVFEVFYEEHAPALLRYFGRWTHDSEVAADLTAETFAAAFEHRGQFRGATDREAGGWLHTIARRRLLAFQRRRAAEWRAVRRLAIREDVPDEDEYDRVDDHDELRQLREAVVTAFDELAPSARLALRLRFVDELDYREIARHLGVNEPAARARVSRALRRLRDAGSG